MRRATAYSNFCSQVVPVCLYLCRRSYMCAAVENCQKILKPPMLRFKVVQGH